MTFSGGMLWERVFPALERSVKAPAKEIPEKDFA